MRVLDKFPADPTKSCATKQRVGINMLKNIVSELCAQSGIELYYTNHSLRATAITRMFNSGIPEKVIAETCGHRSTKALRLYEHTSEQQKQDVTKIINSTDTTIQAVEGVGNHDLDKKSLDNKPDVLPYEDAAQSIAPPNFSGNFSNCTINVSLKQLGILLCILFRDFFLFC